jgi:hypothetical protein
MWKVAVLASPMVRVLLAGEWEAGEGVGEVV